MVVGGIVIHGPGQLAARIIEDIAARSNQARPAQAGGPAHFESAVLGANPPLVGAGAQAIKAFHLIIPFMKIIARRTQRAFQNERTAGGADFIDNHRGVPGLRLPGETSIARIGIAQPQVHAIHIRPG